MPTDTTGTFAKSSEQTITVTSNHYSGYTLSIVGQDDAGQLKSTKEGSSNALDSLVSAVAESTFSSSSNTSYNSMWGFYPSKYNSNNNTYYRPSPTTSATILDKNTIIPSGTGTSTNYTLAIDARANTETPKEPYAAKFTIIAVGNAPKYTVNYYSNTGTPTNMPSSTSGYMSGRSVMVSSYAPEQKGYDFLGWCTITTNNEGCDGDVIQPASEYFFSNINYRSNNTMSFYAIWDEKLPYMQDVLDWEDQIPNTGDQMLVKDKRDNKKYWVAKQADGNIWMTQNLDFEITSAGLTSDTSDLTAYNTNGYTSDAGYSKSGNIIKWMPSSTAITSGRTVPISTSTGMVSGLTNWTNDNYAPYSAEGGDVYVYTSNSTTDDAIYTSLSSCIAASHTETECKHYHRGNYYNWPAAIASNNTNVTELTTRYNTAQNSICPAGWRLPVGAKNDTYSQNNTEFAYLLKQSNVFNDYPSSLTNSTAYITDGFSNIRSNPLFFTRGGHVYSSSLYNSGIYGIYWSSSAYSSTAAFRMSFYSSGIYPAGNYNRSYGFNVRCVARRTMQNVISWADDLEVGEQVTAIDARDNKEYFVAKQADGNIWMTQNLDFEITSTPLTSETSDLTAYNTGGYTSAAGYTQENGIIKWTPASTAVTSGRTVPISTSTGTVSGLTNWTDDGYAPYSAEGGDIYVYTSNSTSNDTIYTSLSSCIAASHTEAECKHYHRGNYYNWSAAVASNNTNVVELTTEYNIAQNSICPAGWRLPISKKSDIVSSLTMEFGNLMYVSGVNNGIGGAGFTSSGLQKLRSEPLYFIRAGSTDDASLIDSGTFGFYWSSSSKENNKAYYLVFGSGYIYVANYYPRYFGANIRCVAR